jgi:group I intron endonuclease
VSYNLIYKTTNIINGKFYVGKHTQHDTSAFDGYLGSGFKLRRAITKYGQENFKREILEVFLNSSLIDEREIFWIASLSATDQNIGYNIHPGGTGNTSEYAKIIMNRPETRKKLVESRSGENGFWWGKKGELSSNWKRNFSEEWRNNISKVVKADKNPRAIFHYILRDPNGKIWETNALQDFCNQHGLIQSCMSRVCNDKQKKHRGWTCVSKTLRIDK